MIIPSKSSWKLISKKGEEEKEEEASRICRRGVHTQMIYTV